MSHSVRGQTITKKLGHHRLRHNLKDHSSMSNRVLPRNQSGAGGIRALLVVGVVLGVGGVEPEKAPGVRKCLCRSHDSKIQPLNGWPLSPTPLHHLPSRTNSVHPKAL